MKKILCILLAAVLCVAAAGCRAAQEASDGSETTAAPATTASVPEESTAPTVEETLDWTEEAGIDVTVSTEGEAAALPFENPGKLRISYEGNRSYVTYITDPLELPAYEELEQYDAAFFADHALVLVVETVSSGSVQVDISSITVAGNAASVTLSRELKGDAGTADMATWMLWAEVEAGLDYQWTVENPSIQSAGVKY